MAPQETSSRVFDPKSFQQKCFDKYSKSPWQTFTPENMDEMQKCFEKFLINGREKGKTIVNNITEMTKKNYKKVDVNISQILLVYIPNAKARDVDCRTFKNEEIKIEMLFRIRNCSTKPCADSVESCCFYLDKFGRTYESWSDFKQRNVYKTGVLIAPQDGIYRGSKENEKMITTEYINTPDLNNLSKIRNFITWIIDVLIIGTSMLLIFQHLLWGEVDISYINATETITQVSCLYGIVVSCYQLSDMKEHQNIDDGNETLEFKSFRFSLHHVTILLWGCSMLVTCFINFAVANGYTIATDFKYVYDGLVILSLLSSFLSILINFACFCKAVYRHFITKKDEDEKKVAMSLELFMLISSILFFSYAYISVYGLTISSSSSSTPPKDEAPKKPGAGGRQRKEKPKVPPAAKPADKIPKKNVPSSTEKILTFEGTNIVYRLASLGFFSVFIAPWMSFAEKWLIE